MGADITFTAKNGKEWYFRDSYNITNLAWVCGLSYWKQKMKNDELKLAKKFFSQLADITDEEIDEYVYRLQELKEDNINNEKENLRRILKEKRDEVLKNKQFVKKAKGVVWSV